MWNRGFTAWAAVALALAGCEKKAAVEALAKVAIVHPDLSCGGETEGTGKGPPNGTEVWCLKKIDGGVVRHGQAIEWFSNEQRKSSGEYQEDKKSGAWGYWYPTGKPKMQGSYVRGVQDGFWTTFHITGERKSEGQMVDGKEHGNWIYWGADNTKVEGAWTLGDQDGQWIDYDAAGIPNRERNYRSGRLINQREILPPKKKKKATVPKTTGG
jgi:antitoxin component YwqK of YwqJK toxin-antitoxin module